MFHLPAAWPDQFGLVRKGHGHGHSRLGHLELGPELLPDSRGAGTVAPEEGGLVGLQQPGRRCGRLRDPLNGELTCQKRSEIHDSSLEKPPLSGMIWDVYIYT